MNNVLYSLDLMIIHEVVFTTNTSIINFLLVFDTVELVYRTMLLFFEYFLLVLHELQERFYLFH